MVAELSQPAASEFLVSVITVTFNAAKTLEETVKSVLAVKTGQVEFIVVDAASTDGTLAILDRYARFIDQRVSEPDQGIYDAMNKGLALARGAYCIFIGADDTLRADGFNAALALLRDERTVYHGKVLRRGADFGAATTPWRILRQNIPHQAIFYPKAVYRALRYSLKYRICADHEYNIKLVGNGTRFVFLDLCIANFGDDGVSSNFADKAFNADYLSIVKHHARKRHYWALLCGKLSKRVLRWTF